MTFRRQAAGKWHSEIPGARWFKADLHVHTIDDLPGGSVKMPSGLSGDPEDPQTLADYARLFLKAAVKRGVQVIGLTPHSPRAGHAPETSAVWRIVDNWNEGIDDDGTPFRKKIYAVFPGFEPSLHEGRQGLHLLFLFDPEVGRDRYLKAFDLVMDGVSPWQGNKLQMSRGRANEVFERLAHFQKSERSVGEDWNSLILAPHIDGGKGLLGGQKAQVRQLFDHGMIAGLELGDGKMPQDALRNRKWLREGMETHRQAFFHASDAKRLDDIGWRHTWIKLARPRIDALRQALVASDSRVRIGFERGADNELREIGNPPGVQLNKYRWLREVTVSGASFFGGMEGGKQRKTRFCLSPDLTCIIGGSMTGKSTLLDGLRVHAGARLPGDATVRKQVEARARDVFGAGTLGINLDCPGADPVAPLNERWPAQFFAQGELQRLSEESTAVEDILARLVPAETINIESRRERLRDLDAQLAGCVQQLSKLDEQHADMEQACERARMAKSELNAFAEAGVEELQQVGRDRQLWVESNRAANSIALSIRGSAEELAAADIPQIDETLTEAFASKERGARDLELGERRAQIAALLREAEQETKAWGVVAVAAVEILKKKEADLREAVERALADCGFGASRLKEVQDLNRRASLLSSYSSELERIDDQRTKTEATFDDLRQKRDRIVGEQRRAFGRVAEEIGREFGTRIQVRQVDNGDSKPLERFLEELRQRGITRWWNDLDSGEKPSPDALIENLRSRTLSSVGMSGAVRKTFEESITRAKERELAALRCPDAYVLEMRMDDDSYRPLNDLSGGQRISVLLSLLLETADDRPLVIDQPEDELDSRFLFDTVLSALKKLRGRRQVIVATHNANMVVNGDADMVIQLDATARRGRVACMGTIDETEVRNAIVRTVDGGEEAFRLRRRKYGF